MQSNPQPQRLDPYLASSLLQKAIRRGDERLTEWSLSEFRRHRGNAVWRRLVTIAFEDIGVAHPALLEDVVEAAIARRSTECARSLAIDMARSTKSRSADHLYSCLAIGIDAHKRKSKRSFAETIAIAADPSRSLVDRATALEIPIDRFGIGEARELSQRISDVAPFLATIGLGLIQPTVSAATVVKHPFVFLLPLLQSSQAESPCSETVQEPAEPSWVDFGGLPSYALDKHTRAGKIAAARMPDACPELADALDRHVLPQSRSEVTQMAAFHADASYVDRKIVWPESIALERQGIEADMMQAGCPQEGALEVIRVVSDNIDCLNDLRGQAIRRGRGQ